jgi:RHS repeat-associated protein
LGDDLVNHYHSGGNQLKVVNDNPTLTHHECGFADNGSFQNTEYNYYENGNMIADLNKGIDLITYNHLNLPTHIYFANNGTAGRRIGYVYTADGIKLRKYTHLNTNAEGPVSDYVGAFVYENNELQFIQTSEGRLVPDGNGGYDYEYALKDHLGNTRVMFSQTGEVLQDQSYYPFGMIMGEALTFDMPSRLPDNKYLYNGKELQDDFDLGWYDYGARFYDPTIGRFNTQDRFAEKYLDFTPYQYGANNPILYVDINGDSLYVDFGVYGADGGKAFAKGNNQQYTSIDEDGTVKEKDKKGISSGISKNIFYAIAKSRVDAKNGLINFAKDVLDMPMQPASSGIDIASIGYSYGEKGISEIGAGIFLNSSNGIGFELYGSVGHELYGGANINGRYYAESKLFNYNYDYGGPAKEIYFNPSISFGPVTVNPVELYLVYKNSIIFLQDYIKTRYKKMTDQSGKYFLPPNLNQNE